MRWPADAATLAASSFPAGGGSDTAPRSKLPPSAASSRASPAGVVRARRFATPGQPPVDAPRRARLAAAALPPRANALAVGGRSAAAATVVARAAAETVATANGAGTDPVGAGCRATAAAGGGAAADPPWLAAAVAAVTGSSTSIPEACSAAMADADNTTERRPYCSGDIFCLGGGPPARPEERGQLSAAPT